MAVTDEAKGQERQPRDSGSGARDSGPGLSLRATPRGSAGCEDTRPEACGCSGATGRVTAAGPPLTAHVAAPGATACLAAAAAAASAAAELLHRPGDRAPRPLAPPRKQGPSEGPPPDPEPKYSGESRPQGDRKRVGTSQNKCLPLPEPGRRHPFTLNFGRGCEISVLGAWSSVVRVRQTGTRRRQMDRKFKVNLELYSEYKTRLGYLRLSPREKRGRKE